MNGHKLIYIFRVKYKPDTLAVYFLNKIYKTEIKFIIGTTTIYANKSSWKNLCCIWLQLIMLYISIIEFVSKKTNIFHINF